MSKSIMTIHKELEREAYSKTPVGQAEKKLRKIYDDLRLSGKTLDKELVDQVNKLRTENEEWQLDYIKKSNQKHKEAIDAKLLETFLQEIELLEKHLTQKALN